ncbi:MAG: aminodeoxychorismate synthase component I [Rhizomicrobium sp.]
MTCREIEILLDDARPGGERLRRFSDPIAVVQTDDPDQVASALATLENARNAGKYVAGYFSYELGYVLESRLRHLLPEQRNVPLVWFGIFNRCEEIEGTAVRAALTERTKGRCYAGRLVHEWSAESYGSRFDRVHAYIEAGDIYQANLSFRSWFAAHGDPMALYLQLRDRSQAAYGAFIDDGVRHILSLSPELFFEISRDGRITARPMKGTARRGVDPMDDCLARAKLHGSVKDRAENLMIVDLLRNDLGRIAKTGSVSAQGLYAIETYPTLHQMVSTVHAQIKPDVTVEQAARALFPCGSVTGTPKIRAMEIIRGLEESPRGVYCGAIGHFAPDGSALFNVAIRTLTLADGYGQLGIGGAIVHDSDAPSEFAECLLKSQFYDVAHRPLELIETLRFSPSSGFVRRDRHLDRMAHSAMAFGIPFRAEDALCAMKGAVRNADKDCRVRLALREDGSFSCTTAVLPATPACWRYSIAPVAMASSDPLLRHKTNWRETYEGALAQARGCDELLFINEHGRLTEGSRTNIFVRKNGKLFTPPLSEGVLPGCLRAELIADGRCEEALLHPRDLEIADVVFFGISLRVLVTAIRVERDAACSQ